MNERWRKRLAKSVKAWREHSGLSKAQLGLALGVHQSNVGRWESGKTIPPLPMLVELAKLVGLRDRYEDIISTSPPRGRG